VAKTASCARRTLAAATSFIAMVIFLVFLTVLIRSRIAAVGDQKESSKIPISKIRHQQVPSVQEHKRISLSSHSASSTPTIQKSGENTTKGIAIAFETTRSIWWQPNGNVPLALPSCTMVARRLRCDCDSSATGILVPTRVTTGAKAEAQANREDAISRNLIVTVHSCWCEKAQWSDPVYPLGSLWCSAD
jgi:septal ring-binding cell division protein DamX